MNAVIMTIALSVVVGQKGEDKKTQSAPMAVKKLPPAFMAVTASNAGEGTSGWVKHDDILVDADGTCYLRKSAKIMNTSAGDQKIFVALSETGWSMDLWAVYVWEPAAQIPMADVIRIEDINLKFLGK